MSDSQLFEDIFTLTAINAQKYDRVSRLSASSNSNECFLTLDVNTELYPVAIGDRVHVVLASTLSLDGSKDDQTGWRELGKNGQGSLADMYDYVCHGKTYRFLDGDNETM